MMPSDPATNALRDAVTHLQAGLARQRAGDLAAARDAFARALTLAPDHVDALLLAGAASALAGDMDDAIAHLTRATEIAPHNPETHLNLGTALKKAGRPVEALAAYEQAIRLAPEHPGVLVNYGIALKDEDRFAEAADLLAKAVRLSPQSAHAHHSLGLALQNLGRQEDAVAHLRQALALNPTLPNARYNLGLTLYWAGGLIPALEAFRAVPPRDGRAAAARAHALFTARRLCDWSREDAEKAALRAALADGATGLPFEGLAWMDDAAEQRAAIEAYVAREILAGRPLPPAPPWRRAPGERLRIGYLCYDFREHPVGRLVVEALGLHDRSRFAVTAYGYGPDDGSALAARIRSGVETFHDVASLGRGAIARRIAQDGIDILVDLQGWTGRTRSALLAQRPAPLQVNWLAFPGTMGASFIDYVIADPVVLPPGTEAEMTERVVRLPHTYQPNDRARAVAPAGTRADHGLPADATVYAMFNQPMKITPAMFGLWMEILSAVGDSVLWLIHTHDQATANLRREAAARGVDPARLVFGPALPNPQHLARYALADLALDTSPYGSHTTGSDALWQGCPLLALRGTAFASRVSASLVTAAGAPDLVTDSPAAYRERAIALGRDRGALGALRARLTAARATAPLFDTPRFVRNLERAFAAMAARAHSGHKPEHIDIPAEGPEVAP